KGLTFVQHKGWRDYYLTAIEKWENLTTEQLEALALTAKTTEPITANIYVAGDVLKPENKSVIFLGRESLKAQFAHKVLSAQQMPMFLIQGQRRTGKTSLLYFLESLLGGRFQVVYQDLQNGETSSIDTWLDNLALKISQKLEIEPPDSFVDEHWQKNWLNMQRWLIQISQNVKGKLILAFDEYEWLHTKVLSKDPEQGGNLLAAMRSFSQQQNKIVFLFVGVALFSELKNPHWNHFFVQAQRFQVDYLTQEDAFKLITEPVNLIYANGLPQQIFNQTQGHPCLLQELCGEIVNSANKNHSKNIEQTQLDQVINKIICDRDNGTLANFWGEFCANQDCKDTVKQILAQQTITSKKYLYRLDDHKFIVEKNGRWQMRVPLLAQWLKRVIERED
ncbi:MAG: ATP-binding protein, partial [Methylococcales bacterium]|nr:ATP-binding protein [Methylococcales bacterium]